MNHLTCQSINAHRHEHEADTSTSASRRKFFKLLGGGAAAIALQGCGGGGVTLTYTPTPATTTPGTSTPVTETPVTGTPTSTAATITWQAIPAIAFIEGVASVFSIADYVSVANATSFSLNASPGLPNGVTFDSVNRAFVYDGIGAMGALDGVVLTATVA